MDIKSSDPVSKKLYMLDMSNIDVWDYRTWPRLNHLIKIYNDLIFDYDDDPRVPIWNSEIEYLRSMLADGQDRYIPF